MYAVRRPRDRGAEPACVKIHPTGAIHLARRRYETLAKGRRVAELKTRGYDNARGSVRSGGRGRRYACHVRAASCRQAEDTSNAMPPENPEISETVKVLERRPETARRVRCRDLCRQRLPLCRRRSEPRGREDDSHERKKTVRK